MQTQVTKIDKQGRIELPKKMRDTFGFQPESDVILELTDRGIFIKPKEQAIPLTERIAQMNLPVAEWDDIEHEIEQGHLRR